MAFGIAAVNGTRLYYEVAGEGAAVVLIHGLCLDTRMWDAQVEALADRYRVIRYDMRGFGKSAASTGADFRHADDLRALLDYLGAPSAHVIGLSMGGAVALQFALLNPSCTLSLTLVDSAIDRHEWSTRWDASFDPIEERARVAGPKAGNEMWIEHELFAPARERPDCGSKLAQIVAESPGLNWVSASGARGIKPPASERLGEIGVPTLVVVGERDLPDFQQIADKLAREIRGARKVVVPGVGHMSSMEDPQSFNALVLDFLASVQPA